MPNALYWAALSGAVAVALLVRALHGGPLSKRPFTLSRLDVGFLVVSLVGLGFHCAAMFFPTAVANVPGLSRAAEAVRDAGAVSQIAYWLPAGMLVWALRRAWAPLLVTEVCVLVAVGVTMFWSFGLTWHLVALASSVALTLVMLTTATARSRLALV